MIWVRQLRWPPAADLPFVVIAGGVWVGLLIAPGTGRSTGTWISAMCVVVVVGGVAWRSRRPVMLALAGVAVLVGGAVALIEAKATRTIHDAQLPSGAVDIVGVVLDDPVAEPFGVAVTVDVLRIGADPMAAETPIRLVLRGATIHARPGDVVRVDGVHVFRRPGWHRGRPITGSVGGVVPAVVGAKAAPYLRVGNLLRDRVLAGLEHRGTQAEALTKGLLIGDTSSLGAVELEELRRAGLTHFVAVSGGNVALFLGGIWLMLMPLPISSRARATVGVVALTVFVAMTRWEPSVVRAAAMASVVLGGRIVGLPIDAWRAVGVGVAGALVIAPGLVSSVGFHLSVAATCGLLLASGLGNGRRPVWLWRSLIASTAAQVAVLPLLIVTFGSVPLMAPAANVAAAPLVSLATIVSGLGVAVGIEQVVGVGVAVAGLILEVASVAALGPQLGLAGVGIALAVGGLLVSNVTRSIGAASVVAVALVASPSAPAVVADSVTVLDVGQGDAVVVRGADGTVVAIDTGPDPVAYLAALRRVGVEHVDLLVLTHGDMDHVGGAADLVERLAVGVIWLPRRDPPVAAVQTVIETAADRGVPVRRPSVGEVVHVGGVVLEVLGPLRRYDAENDESTVLLASGNGRSMLLAGDIEAVAQTDLPPLRPDVVLVPHHGSATTDLGWLAATVGETAVISVGDNPFGHPHPTIRAALERAGVEVFVTQEVGDVIVPLGGVENASGALGMVGS